MNSYFNISLVSPFVLTVFGGLGLVEASQRLIDVTFFFSRGCLSEKCLRIQAYISLGFRFCLAIIGGVIFILFSIVVFRFINTFINSELHGFIPTLFYLQQYFLNISVVNPDLGNRSLMTLLLLLIAKKAHIYSASPFYSPPPFLSRVRFYLDSAYALEEFSADLSDRVQKSLLLCDLIFLKWNKLGTEIFIQ